MVANSTRTVGIVVASILALGLIGIAFLVSGPLPFRISTANAGSTHDLLVQYASKDSDNDGLPDWEEALYGTDPHNPHSVSQTVTDGEAVAQGLVAPKFASATTTPANPNSIPAPTVASSTVTDQFAKALFGQYLQNRGTTPPTPNQIATLVEQGVAQLVANSSFPDAFNSGQLHVSGSGPAALTAYAAAVENVFATNAVPASQSEVLYFSDAVNKNDPAALAKVTAIGTEYAKVARALMQIPVPKEAAGTHLQLANALMHMSEITLDLAAFNIDPLRSMVGLGKYEQMGTLVVRALATMNGVFVNEGVTLTSGAPGYSFYSTTVEAAQANATASQP